MLKDDQAESPKEERQSRKKRGKIFINQERCKGCGYCVEFCPTHVLALADYFNKKGYHPPEVVNADACTGCDLCGMYCPDFAIFAVRIKRDKSTTTKNTGSIQPSDLGQKEAQREG